MEKESNKHNGMTKHKTNSIMKNSFSSHESSGVHPPSYPSVTRSSSSRPVFTPKVTVPSSVDNDRVTVTRVGPVWRVPHGGQGTRQYLLGWFPHGEPTIPYSMQKFNSLDEKGK